MKISYTLEKADVKAAFELYLQNQGHPVQDSDQFSINPDGTATVLVTQSPSAPSLGQGAPPVRTPSTLSDPGPPYSLKCVATCFGYEDPGDRNHTGAFIDPATGRNYDTGNTTLVGVSVPIPILDATFGAVGLDRAVSQHSVTVMLGSAVKRGIPIVDEGPGESVGGQHGLLVGKDGVLHALDMTYALCEALGVKYDANSASYEVTWWIEDQAGHPVEMKGLDSPKKVV
jgi:hypothetical protein